MGSFYVAQPVGPHRPAARSTGTFTAKQDVTPAPIPILDAGKLHPESNIYIKAWGDYSCTGTPNLTLGFWHGGLDLTISGDIALGPVFTCPSGAAAFPWWMDWEGICTVQGVSGSLVGQGQQQMGATISTFNAETPVPLTAALRTVTFNTTIVRGLGVSATWSASSASNIVTVNGFRVIIWN